MKITEYILNNKKINDTVSKVIGSSNHNNIYIGNSSANYSKYLAVSTFLKTNKTLVYLASDIYHASSAYDTFLDILGKEFVSFFPGEEFVSQEMVASSSMFKLARMNALSRIINNKPTILVINTEGALKNVMSKDKIKDSILTLRLGDIYNKEEL